MNTRPNNETERELAVEAMQKVLTPLSLKFYDLYVLGLSSRFLWRCPASVLQDLYDRNISGRHLDVGVGTGYFLDKARLSSPSPRITLMDINEHCLAMVSQRIARLRPTPILADVLDPLPDIGPFDSVGMCYVLHCLPGNMRSKSRVFDNVHSVLAPGAAVFGATIVQGNAPRSSIAQSLMDVYNTRNVFSNSDDRAEHLEEMLSKRFTDVRVRLRGCVAIFEARKARQ